MEWIEGLKQWKLWSSLAYQDIRNRYRRSLLGPLWITITMGATILAMGPLYGGLFGNQDQYFIPKLGFGLIIWSLISSTITDSVECFVGSAHIIKNIKLPYSVYMYRIIARQFILFLHNSIIFVPIYIFYPELFNFNIAFSIVGIVILMVWISQVGSMIAILCSRYRDFGPLITNLTQLLFFVTPIVWPVSQLSGARMLVVELNPIYYLLEMVRLPLMGKGFEFADMSVVVLMMFMLSVLFNFIFKKNIKRLAYWL